MNQRSAEPDKSTPDFELETFFPYLVRVFYADVTRALADVYERDYGLSPAEWRTMAILGSQAEGLQASDIVTRSSMDKVVVSRAVKRMEARGLLTRKANEADGRSHLLMLSEPGRAAYEDLAPKLKTVEHHMLAGLEETDIQSVLNTMTHIRTNLANLKAGDG